MNYGADHDSLLLNNYFIDHPIWKVLRISPANVLAWVAAAMQQRGFGQRVEHFDDFFRESEAKPFTAVLVPGGRFQHIILTLRAYNNPPFHCPKRVRSDTFRSSTSIY